MTLTKDKDGVETGDGVVFRAIRIGFDDNKKLKLEGQALEPLRLTQVTRKK